MTQEDKIIKNKLGALRLADMLSNVSQACKVMGYSRDSFYRFKELYDTGGELALREISRKKAIPKNRVEEAVEEGVIAFAIKQPTYGQVRVANEMKKQGLFISPGVVRSVGLLHHLKTFKKRFEDSGGESCPREPDPNGSPGEGIRESQGSVKKYTER